MCAASFFKRVANIPSSLCLVVGGVMSRALYLGGVMIVGRKKHGLIPVRLTLRVQPLHEMNIFIFFAFCS